MSLLRNGRHSRRMLLKTGPFFLGSFAVAACRQRLAGSALQANERPVLAPNLPPTPACGDDPTPSQTAGPFYTPNSPERTSLLELDTVGTPMMLTGQVVSTRCTPIAGALVDFWHTNAEGEYDNSGYTFRGHQFTNEEGRYHLETILPGL
jgi:protocatechuate 3,4-dioxygenase beta subunit